LLISFSEDFGEDLPGFDDLDAVDEPKESNYVCLTPNDILRVQQEEINKISELFEVCLPRVLTRNESLSVLEQLKKSKRLNKVCMSHGIDKFLTHILNICALSWQRSPRPLRGSYSST